ncbi:MAG TPA: GTPase, partial [Coleofasciculaceae cyanobacterium]
RKAHAYILLVAAHRPREFRDARRILGFMKQRSPVPMIIGLTHVDCEGAWDVENVAIALGYLHVNSRPPIIVVDPNDSASVATAIITLVQHSMQNCMV